jgi:hypothetical protein
MILFTIHHSPLTAAAQDSVKLKITKVGTMEKRTVYWFAVPKKDTSTILLVTGERVLLRKQRPVAICDCKHKRGEIVTVAKKDLVIIKDSFTKQDLEN